MHGDHLSHVTVPLLLCFCYVTRHRGHACQDTIERTQAGEGRKSTGSVSIRYPAKSRSTRELYNSSPFAS